MKTSTKYVGPFVTKNGLKTNPVAAPRDGLGVVKTPYLPTPDQIAECCERIRETWPEERVESWEVPEYFLEDLISK